MSPSTLPNIKNRTSAIILLFGFTAIQILYYWQGIRFDSSPLFCYWQYLDPLLLKTRLSESLIFLHSQPPGFNLFLGIILKVFDQNFDYAFWLIYLSIGLATVFLLYQLTRSFEIQPWIGLSLTLIFAASPSFVLYQHLLFYAFFELFLLLASAWCLARMLSKKSFAACFCFFSCLLLLCLLRSLYHWIFFVGIVLWLLSTSAIERKTLLKAAALPLTLLLSFYLKNYILFGQFSLSSWLGMNLSNNLAVFVPPEVRSRLIEQQKLSPLANHKPFEPLASYPGFENQPLNSFYVPALDHINKQESLNAAALYRQTNFNHRQYQELSRQFKDVFFEILKHYPRAIILRTFAAWNFHFYSSSRYRRLEPNLTRIQALNEFVDRYLYGRVSFDSLTIDDKPAAVYLTLLVGIPLLVLYALLEVFAVEPRLSREKRQVISYMLICIFYVSLLGNFVEMPENNRFRFSLDPFFLLFLGLILNRASDRFLNYNKSSQAQACATY